MVKTIFDLADRRKEKNPIGFSNCLDWNGDWKRAILDSSDWDNCIEIKKDNVYEYYVCFDNGDNLA